jgi:hypothetical protein
MAYILEDLRTSVKNRIADPNFNNALIDEFINDEQKEILGYYNLPFNRTQTQYTVTQGTSTIPLPARHQKTIGLRVIAPKNDDRDLSRYFLPWKKFKQTFREPDYYSNTDLLYWSIFNDNIVFAYNSDKTYTVEHDYITTVEDLVNDTDVPKLPEEFREILVLGAMVRAYEVNDDNDIAQYQQGKKNLLVQAMLKRYAPQQSAATSVLSNSYRGV